MYARSALPQVHYIIDYYYNPAGPANAPSSHPAAPVLTQNILVDVRPAVEDFSSLMDRVRRFPERMWTSLQQPRFRAEGIDPSTAPPEVKAPEMLHSSEAPPAPQADLLSQVDTKCATLLQKLREATGEEDKRSAHVALNYCMGRVACPEEAKSFMSILEKNQAANAAAAGLHGGLEDAAFQKMTSCVAHKLSALREQPGSELR